MRKKNTLMLFVALLLSAYSIDAQDLPTTAIVLTVGSNSSEFPVVLSNVNATNSEDTDPMIPFPSCASYAGADSWCSVEVPENGALQLMTMDIGGGVSDTGMSVYEGTPTSLTEIGCNDDDVDVSSYLSFTNRTPGEILYVRTFAYSNFSTGEYSLSAYEVNMDPPANDDISGAIELVIGDSFSDFSIIGNNTNATDSEAADSSIPNPTCSYYNGGDVWYYIDVTSQETFFVETAFAPGGFSDSGMAIYTGEEGSLSQINCDDDGGLGAFSKITLSDLTQGERLYVRVFEYGNSAFGVFEISAHSNIIEVPSNDNPNGAIALTAGATFEDNSIIASNALATNSGSLDQSIEDPSCILFFEGGDVWFTAEIPNTGELTVEIKGVSNSGFEDSTMSLYEGSPGELSEIACNDDVDFSLFSKIELVDRTPGEIVYIRVFEYNANSGDFEISVYSPGIVSVEDETFIEGLSLSPNPVQHTLNLKAISPIGNVKVFSLLGEKVIEVNAPNSEYQLDVSTMTIGTYLIQFRAGEQTVTHKFVKI